MYLVWEMFAFSDLAFFVANLRRSIVCYLNHVFSTRSAFVTQYFRLPGCKLCAAYVAAVACSSIHTHKSPGSRHESTLDLRCASPNRPSNLLPRSSQRRRQAPPFLKRYTIADFANTRAYQESTASLISASADHGLFSLNSATDLVAFLLDRFLSLTWSQYVLGAAPPPPDIFLQFSQQLLGISKRNITDIFSQSMRILMSSAYTQVVKL